MKFLPFDTTTVLLDAGQETPVSVGEEPGPVVVVVDGVQFGSWYTVRRLPAPQNSVVSLAQSMLQSASLVLLAPGANSEPQ